MLALENFVELVQENLLNVSNLFYLHFFVNGQFINSRQLKRNQITNIFRPISPLYTTDSSVLIRNS